MAAAGSLVARGRACLRVDFQAGRYLRACVRVNAKKRTEAYMIVEGLQDVDVFVDGEQARNRCATFTLTGFLGSIRLLRCLLDAIRLHAVVPWSFMQSIERRLRGCGAAAG